MEGRDHRIAGLTHDRRGIHGFFLRRAVHVLRDDLIQNLGDPLLLVGQRRTVAAAVGIRNEQRRTDRIILCDGDFLLPPNVLLRSGTLAQVVKVVPDLGKLLAHSVQGLRKGGVVFPQRGAVLAQTGVVLPHGGQSRPAFGHLHIAEPAQRQLRTDCQKHRTAMTIFVFLMVRSSFLRR